MQSIFEGFETVLGFLRTTIEGIVNFFRTALWGIYQAETFYFFVPSSVALFIGVGIVLTLILKIIGRSSSK